MARTSKRSTKGRGRPKATAGKLTAKQEEVKRLLDMGQSVEEIALLMETTPGAIKSQISRIRKLGVAVPPGATIKENDTRGDEPQSVEEHVVDEIEATDSRLAVVAEALVGLSEEQAQLESRKGRLEAARADLADPPLTNTDNLAAVA